MQLLGFLNTLLLNSEPVGKLLLTNLFESLGVRVKFGHDTQILEWVPLDTTFDLSCAVGL